MSRKLSVLLLSFVLVSLLVVSGCIGKDNAKVDLSTPPPLPEDEDVEDSGQIPSLPPAEGDSLPPLPAGEDNVVSDSLFG